MFFIILVISAFILFTIVKVNNDSIFYSQYRNKQKYGHACYTTDGVKVRSYGEKKIGDFLLQQNIKFIYEDPIHLGKTTIKPDFYLPEFDLYIEFWGLLGIPKYNYTISLKRKIYNEYDIKVIDIYPNNLKNLFNVFHARFKKLTNKTVIEFKKENNIESTIESNLHKLRETFNKKGDSIGYGILSEENIHLLVIQKFENIDNFLDTYHVTRKLYYGGLLKYSIQKGIECNK